MSQEKTICHRGKPHPSPRLAFVNSPRIPRMVPYFAAQWS